MKSVEDHLQSLTFLDSLLYLQLPLMDIGEDGQSGMLAVQTVDLESKIVPEFVTIRNQNMKEKHVMEVVLRSEHVP